MDKITKKRILNILKHINLVLEDTKDSKLEDLTSDSILGRATALSIEQIGEGMSVLYKKIGEQYPNLPWKKTIGTRIIIAHHYDALDNRIIFNIAKRDLVELKEQLENLLENNQA